MDNCVVCNHPSHIDGECTKCNCGESSLVRPTYSSKINRRVEGTIKYKGQDKKFYGKVDSYNRAYVPFNNQDNDI